jgi:glycine/D-amino acid oxidase-like deaminating enzyme
MTRIANERAALADSLWTATANPAPARPALDHAAEADVAIVGGGFTGLSAALHLAEAERAGAQLYGESRVTALRSDGESVTVETASGQVTARHALICTNAYTGGLADPVGRSVLPVTSIQVATEPLCDNLAKSILPEGQQVSDSRRLLLYFRKDAEGRFLMGGRGALGEAGTRARHEALRAVSVRLYPQLKDVRWTHAWGGDVALTQSHRPGLHRLAPGVMAALGYNGRGVAMATAMGRLLADWAEGKPEAELDFPVTEARPIPFHRFRRLGLGPMVATFSVLDRLGL